MNEEGNQITAPMLFDRCLDILAKGPAEDTARQIHETLVMACAEGTRRQGRSFGNVFAQVDYLCKKHGVKTADKLTIQAMRRRSNEAAATDHETLMYDIRALCLFISAVFATAIPDRLTRRIPHINKPVEKREEINARYIRCIVDAFDDKTIMATTDGDSGGREICIDYTADSDQTDRSYLRRLLAPGMQLNLLDCHVDDKGQVAVVRPGIIVVEPDFLLDISAIAACFTDYGHSPMAYTINRLKPRANTQPILLGNFAGRALDDIINNKDFSFQDSLMKTFKQQALQFCACRDFNAKLFMQDARQQTDNIKGAVEQLFSGSGTREKAILEPSFVCERLGLQGRVDLMTTDMKMLVEQKSGKNWFLSNRVVSADNISRYIEAHYVQLLLYYGILRHNFGISPDNIDMSLLYSKYPAPQGLVDVNYYKRLFLEAIKLRNRIVAGEFTIARRGFGCIAPWLSADSLNENNLHNTLFENYIRPQVDAVVGPLHSISPLEEAYFNTMATFVYREQTAQRVGAQEGVSSSLADLWNMPLQEKIETGNIYTGLSITAKEQSDDYNGYDTIRLSVPAQGDDFLPNFRRGDAVYLYRYDRKPDVRKSILYRGVMTAAGVDEIEIRLNDGQQNPRILSSGTYAVEHGASDSGSPAQLRSLHTFITRPAAFRSLLLGEREPQADTSRRLSKTYNKNYDDILLRIKQADDYFLLVGPPGTGKTSMALRYIVEEELTSPDAGILLTAYTNRAVDEICSMLDDAGLDYLRIGNDSSCDPRYHDHLLEAALTDKPRLDDIRRKITGARIITGTTSMMLSRSYIFDIKAFTLTVVDEASQILEPGIVGLLTGKFVLIGDYKQLPAVVVQSEAESAVADRQLRDRCITDCRNSLFERLIRWEKKCGRTQFTGILNRQGRMHPDVARFTNELFYPEEQLQPVPCPHQTEEHLNYTAPSEDPLDDILKQHRVIYMPVAPDADAAGQKSNPAEARVVADLVRRIARFYGERFDAAKTIGIIVPYRNQISMIRREIGRGGDKRLGGISIDTVERYQGSQRDVIIYSFTVTRAFQLGFLTSNSFREDGRLIDRKLNVAMTRARCQMILTGCTGVLSQNELFATMIDRYDVRKYIKSAENDG